MRPQDIVILLKILCYGTTSWFSKDLARELNLSPSEISNALNRNAEAGLIDTEKKLVKKQALLEFLVHGIQYVFPVRPKEMVRGILTAHSHPFFKNKIVSEVQYVWPDAESDERGFSVQPLYLGAVVAAKKDDKLYLLLALVDVIRLGKVRERTIAIKELESIIVNA